MSEDYETPKDDINTDATPEASAEHTDYKPADANAGDVKHRLSGMYQTWFLECNAASCTPCAAWRTDDTTRWPTSWARP